jgi:hypothetical protein
MPDKKYTIIDKTGEPIDVYADSETAAAQKLRMYYASQSPKVQAASQRPVGDINANFATATTPDEIRSQAPGAAFTEFGTEAAKELPAGLAILSTLSPQYKAAAGLGKIGINALAGGAGGIGKNLFKQVADEGKSNQEIDANEMLIEGGKQGALQGFIEAGAQGAVKIGGKVFTAAKPRLDKATQELYDFSKTLKLNLPPSLFTGSKMSHWLETVASKPVIANMTMREMYKDGISAMKEYGDFVTSKIGKLMPDDAALEKAKAMIMGKGQNPQNAPGVLDRMKETVDEAYEKFYQAAGGKDAPVTAKSLISRFKTIIKGDNTIYNPETKAYARLWLDPPQGTAKDVGGYLYDKSTGGWKNTMSVEKLHKRLMDTWDESKGADAKIMDFIRDDIKTLLKQAGERGGEDTFTSANNIYRMVNSFKNHEAIASLGKKFDQKGAALPNRFVRKIFESGDASFADIFKKTMQSTPDTAALYDTLRAKNIENMLNGYKIKTFKDAGYDLIDGAALQKNITDNMDTMKVFYDPDTIKALWNLGEISKRAKSEYTAVVSKGGGLADIAIAYGGHSAGGIAGAIAATVGTEAGATALVHDLLRPNGYLKRFLVEGIKIPSAGGLVGATLKNLAKSEIPAALEKGGMMKTGAESPTTNILDFMSRIGGKGFPNAFKELEQLKIGAQ